MNPTHVITSAPNTRLGIKPNHKYPIIKTRRYGRTEMALIRLDNFNAWVGIGTQEVLLKGGRFKPVMRAI